MFLIFFALSSSRKPIILFPGLGGSVLNGNVTKKPYFYCNLIKDHQVYISWKYVFPLHYNCLLDYLKLEWDDVKQEPKQPDYVQIEPPKMGNMSGINYVDTLMFNIHVVPYYRIFVAFLHSAGYNDHDDLYGAPFDWRFGVDQKPEFYSSFKNLVEEIYSQKQKKVVLIGHSLGCFLINEILTNKMEKEWVTKYIDSVVYIAPSFGGSVRAFNTMRTKFVPFVEFLGKYTETMSSMLGVSIHLPNFGVYGNETVITDENGNNISASGLPDYLRNSGLINENDFKLLQRNIKYFEKLPQEPPVPASIVYNSGIKTLKSIDMRKSIFRRYTFGRGDILVNAEGPEYACKHWKNIKCYDFNTNNYFYNHFSMLYSKSLFNFVNSTITDQNFKSNTDFHSNEL